MSWVSVEKSKSSEREREREGEKDRQTERERDLSALYKTGFIFCISKTPVTRKH